MRLVIKSAKGDGAAPFSSHGKIPAKHDWSSAQFNMPPEIAMAIKDFSRDIDKQRMTVDGREKEPHITILYGIETDDPSKIIDAPRDKGPISLKIGKLSLFQNDDADVLKLGVDSSDLHDLNKHLRGELPHVDKQDDYAPHCTVCYLKSGEGSRFVGKSIEGATGETVQGHTVRFSSKSGAKRDIALKKQQNGTR